jgi:hypothetical protein
MLVRPLLEDGSFARPRLLLEEQRFSPHGSAAVLRAAAPTADVAAPRALPTPPPLEFLRRQARQDNSLFHQQRPETGMGR